jgi:hypothetical protein
MPLQNLFADLGRRKFYTTGARVWGGRCGISYSVSFLFIQIYLKYGVRGAAVG